MTSLTRRDVLAVGIGSAVVAALDRLPAEAEPSPKPDIVVVVLDDMRSSDWAALPKTQALLAGGTWFPNYLTTTPLCAPSRATMLTGLYAHNHGVKNNYPRSSAHRVFSANGNPARTVAKALHDDGYRTGLVGKYMNGYMGQEVPEGWDFWRPHRGRPEYHVGNDYSTTRYREQAVEFVGGTSEDQPMLLWFAPNAPHEPAMPEKQYKKQQVESADPPSGSEMRRLDQRRLRTLLSVDDAVAAIAEAMGDRWDQACVFVVSDNGYQLGGHGVKGKGVGWDGSVRVRTLARCPGFLEPGTDDRLAANIDIAPTIAALAGVAMPDEVDGRSLVDDWTREALLTEGWAKLKVSQKFLGVRTPTWSYLTPGGSPRLYDWQNDPGERNDLAHTAETQPLVAALAARLDQLRECSGDACREADSAPL